MGRGRPTRHIKVCKIAYRNKDKVDYFDFDSKGRVVEGASPLATPISLPQVTIIPKVDEFKLCDEVIKEQTYSSSPVDFGDLEVLNCELNEPRSIVQDNYYDLNMDIPDEYNLDLPFINPKIDFIPLEFN